MTTYIRPGGLWRDVPVEFEAAVRDFIEDYAAALDEYESLLTKNALFLERTDGYWCDLRAEDCIAMGFHRPHFAGHRHSL